MAKSKQHTPPSTHQLRQYVAGTLTPQDQHKVEKEALQNQQVDDTLEGSRRVAPIPMRHSSPIVQAWMIAAWPIVHHLPM